MVKPSAETRGVQETTDQILLVTDCMQKNNRKTFFLNPKLQKLMQEIETKSKNSEKHAKKFKIMLKT